MAASCRSLLLCQAFTADQVALWGRRHYRGEVTHGGDTDGVVRRQKASNTLLWCQFACKSDVQHGLDIAEVAGGGLSIQMSMWQRGRGVSTLNLFGIGTAVK